MISFVFYASVERCDNLKQTLRMLEQREKLIDKEIIIVWQDEGPQIENTTSINLKMDTYRKPKQCNEGVKAATNKIVALLDSDRILPKNYFAEQSSKLVEKEFITTTHLLKCKKPYEDHQIDEFKFEGLKEFRSKTIEIQRKNLFSGNTLFYKKDYLDCGGMDENYVGYGYADNDMTRTVEKYGCISTYVDCPEIHLWHPVEINYEGHRLQMFKIISATNLMYYCKKWQLKDLKAETIIQEVYKNINKFPEKLQDQFKKAYRFRYGSILH